MSARRKPAVTPAVPSHEVDHAAPLPATFLPSIHALGVAWATAYKEVSASLEGLNRNTPEKAVRARWAEDTFGPRADALRNLITTLPAETLADVVVQLGFIATSLSTEVEDAGGDDDERRRFAALGRTLERIALSGIMVLAREGGVDLEALDLYDVPKLHASRFAGLGGVA